LCGWFSQSRGVSVRGPMVFNADNQGITSLAKHLVFHDRSKHYRIQSHEGRTDPSQWRAYQGHGFRPPYGVTTSCPARIPLEVHWLALLFVGLQRGCMCSSSSEFQSCLAYARGRRTLTIVLDEVDDYNFSTDIFGAQKLSTFTLLIRPLPSQFVHLFARFCHIRVFKDHTCRYDCSGMRRGPQI